MTATTEPGAGVAFVLGGTGGLGQAICRAIAAAGRPVFFTYRNRREAAEALVREIADLGGSADCAPADLGSIADIQAALGRALVLGEVDAVVHAAGPDIPQLYVSAVTPEQWRDHVLSELTGFFNVMHVTLPALRTRPRSAIVATTSCAVDRVIAGDVLSAVPKAGIEMLVRQIAREEGRFGVRANCVAPGIIDAGLGLKAQQDFYTPEIWEAQRRGLPLRAFGSAGQIASAVLFLLSEASGYVTGQTIVADGGLSV